jgi:hypothetical protein
MGFGREVEREREEDQGGRELRRGLIGKRKKLR